MRYVKNTMGIAEQQQLEVARMENAEQATEQEKQAAKLDYMRSILPLSCRQSSACWQC